MKSSTTINDLFDKSKEEKIKYNKFSNKITEGTNMMSPNFHSKFPVKNINNSNRNINIETIRQEKTYAGKRSYNSLHECNLVEHLK